MNFAYKIVFVLLLKMIIWCLDNYMIHCQGENDFGLLHLFIFVAFHLKENFFQFSIFTEIPGHYTDTYLFSF